MLSCTRGPFPLTVNKDLSSFLSGGRNKRAGPGGDNIMASYLGLPEPRGYFTRTRGTKWPAQCPRRLASKQASKNSNVVSSRFLQSVPGDNTWGEATRPRGCSIHKICSIVAGARQVTNLRGRLHDDGIWGSSMRKIWLMQSFSKVRPMVGTISPT